MGSGEHGGGGVRGGLWSHFYFDVCCGQEHVKDRHIANLVPFSSFGSVGGIGDGLMFFLSLFAIGT